jgi:cytochrome c553
MRVKALGLCSLVAAAAVTFGLSGAAAAQDANFGKSVWLTQANCAECHGWFGNGEQEDPRAPKGASLRKTNLNAQQLAEVILCGRPGTEMPHFDLRAYTDARCFGMTAAQIGNQKPPPASMGLTQRHADGLAAFILAVFAGKGGPTRAECADLLGATNPRCATLPQ